MDVRQFEIFLAVLDHSSVTRAAQKLGLSPGAVSLQLHGLANELRTDLFVHSGKRIVPRCLPSGDMIHRPPGPVQ